MRRLTTIALSLVLVSVALPTATVAGEADETIREDNRAWLLEQNPEYDPDAIVELHTGDGVEEITAEQALERTLDRAGEASLAALTHGAGDGDGEAAGDIWLIGTGDVACGEVSRLAHQPVEPLPPGPQISLHDGAVGYATDASADRWTVISWTTKRTVDGSGIIHYGGVSDFFCTEQGPFEILFPFVDGYTTTIASPPVVVEDPVA